MNTAGARAILRDPGVVAELEARARRSLAAARAAAEQFKQTGNYLNGLDVEVITTDRVVARVVARAPHSHLVEARHGTLARAIDAAGGA
ncbi:hypothetical protein [Nocardioides marinquilinus]